MENFINLSQRQLRVGEQVRQIISNFLLKDIVLDNYLTNASVTVSRVIMSKDLKIASDESILSLSEGFYLYDC